MHRDIHSLRSRQCSSFGWYRAWRYIAYLPSLHCNAPATRILANVPLLSMLCDIRLNDL